MAQRKTKRLVRRELVENELLERAADLFAERGFNGTSLQDVADTMGMTRPAIYHYFESKEALLTALVEGLTEGRAAQLAAIRRRTDLSSAEKLRAATTLMATQMARHPARFRLLIQGEADLPEHLASKNNKAKRDVLAHVVAIIDEGVRSGVFRARDPRLAAFAILGMCNWIAWWFKPQSPLSVETVAEEFAHMAALSLQTDRGSADGGGIAGTFKTIKDGLARLEVLVEERETP
jgi:AcrR family transcriptional regulator